MPWDDLVSTANKAEAKAKTQKSIYLDQQSPKGKRPLKMSFNSQDNQLKNAQNLARPHRAKARPARPNKRIKQRKPRARKPEKKRRKEDT